MGSLARVQPLNSRQHLWRTITRFDREKLAPVVGARNAIGVSIPLVVAVWLGNPAAGTAASTGALNVAFTDGSDPYFRRAGRMLSASAVGAIAVFLGAVCGNHHMLAVCITAAWAFAAGMLVSLDSAAADIGLISLVTFVVFAAQPMAFEQALQAGLLATAGGLLQTLLSIALWPLRRYEPERRVLGNLFNELSRTAAAPAEASQSPSATAQINEAHRTLTSTIADRSPQRERYVSLLNQAERIRLSLLIISRSKVRLGRDFGAASEAALLQRVEDLTSHVLSGVGNELLGASSTTRSAAAALREIEDLAEQLRRDSSGNLTASLAAMLADARFQVDAIAGQLRSSVDLMSASTPTGRVEFEQRQAARPWHLRVAGTFAILRANLSVQSAAFRHAVRLAVCVTLGDALARGLGWSRGYWVPMTIAIILKPDFTTTFSRGVLRMAGTFIGLVLATAIFDLLSPGSALQVALIFLFTFALRFLGPANYGLFVIAVSALVVLLFAVTGVEPGDVAGWRGLDTLLGGVLALVVFAAWPTWERTQVSEMAAALLDAYRKYFHAVRDGYLRPQSVRVYELDRARLAGRLARTNLEASIDRAVAEPGVSREFVSLLSRMTASSHRLAHAVMSLEAGLLRDQITPVDPAFRRFANDVELTLHSLAAALRGSPLRPGQLPDLREDHHAFTERYTLLYIECDRITNSLNTFTEQMFECLALMDPVKQP
jgi:uncharacterized membrane protein YccC